ncbi:ferritin-like domain-containing protein [Mucilaginibacter lappiensis]|uniref:Iminophenyl-pyruvate dimer synthase domain-containing protein n=1 Tax=Mucilaginibacter lappiensis TaxID=354630 RepID=A0A841JKF8_9SPHI|nr:ferritin-like domain-containing protein [Mucilaginibacter lappiensis]MBB6130944.1 hypothetical protein [Mucilaginibacter lappiensis]
MQNLDRFLKPVFERAENLKSTNLLKNADGGPLPGSKEKVEIPYEFSAKDYLAFLLSINAEIEHGLMLQYLYAGYSMGGEQVVLPEHQEKVRNWKELILGVAKEEMGHFISVQNILKVIGAPLNFGRTDYPWDTPFYPFPFTLEPLTLKSLAKYVYAESPEHWIDSDNATARKVKELVHAQTADPHRVGALFKVMMEIVKDTEQIPDSLFQSNSFPYQAKFDEWGRSYTGSQGNASPDGSRKAPDVLVLPLTCRDDAYNALMEISEQGEAPKSVDDGGKPSHFNRFLQVFEELSDIMKDFPDFQPARKVAINPFIPGKDAHGNLLPSVNVDTDEEQDAITNPEARAWGHLLNVRYHLLLNYLAHSFVLDDGFNGNGAVSARATIINATFGEMYNLRSISHVMVQLPLNLEGEGNINAGPPFTIPYTLNLPMGEHNRWIGHQNLLEASATIVSDLLKWVKSENNQRYLHALTESDEKLLQIISKLTNPTNL